MGNAYQPFLKKLKATTISLHRADTTTLRGKVADVLEDGCVIAVPAEQPGMVESVFVAYRDVRGIGSIDWDLDSVAH
jgi:hypothetical protein